MRLPIDKEIKPCKECGSEAVVGAGRDEHGGYVGVYCEKCLLTACVYVRHTRKGQALITAINKWNKGDVVRYD